MHHCGSTPPDPTTRIATAVLGGFLLGAGAAMACATRQIAHAKQQARRDPLTGALNRNGWVRAARDIITASPLSTIALVDVDKFKTVNDTAGHAAGDALLRRLVDDLDNLTGVVVGRLGGDEFAVAAPHPIALPGRLGGSPVSIGMTTVFRTPRGAAPDAIAVALTEADRAMYRAKRQGGARAENYHPRIDGPAVISQRTVTRSRDTARGVA